MKRPLSMTSFGRGEYSTDGRTWVVEIRSVNHRYNDVSIKLPRKIIALEDRIKKEISAVYSRGRVEASVTTNGEMQEATTLTANLPLAREYFNCLSKISQSLSLPTSPDLTMLLGFKDIIVPMEQEQNIENIWTALQPALNAAIQEGLHMRTTEGAALKTDLLAMLSGLKRTLSTIEIALPELLGKKKAQLKERLDNLLKEIDIDPVRLAQEVAIIADRFDISEEIVRLGSHINQFSLFLDMDEPTGRRLDFLLQEFFREINTISSKISDASLAHLTVHMKNEVEKMREQVQNLE